VGGDAADLVAALGRVAAPAHAHQEPGADLVNEGRRLAGGLKRKDN
jgi:hypothetical protein